MSTQELIEKCISRDKLAWNEFVLRYEGLVRRAVHYKLNRMNSRSLRSEADDIVQEVFLMLWRDNKLTRLKDLSCLKSWLVIVTLNRTSNYCQKRWRDQRMTRSLNEGITSDESYTLEDVIPSKASTPDRSLGIKEMLEDVTQRVNRLKEKERKVLELNLYAGKKQSDIADMLDIPVGTVASLITRAKSKVKSGLKEYCLS